MELVDKSCPLLQDLPGDAEDRVDSCEVAGMSSEEGTPLLLCALQDWVAVGLPSSPDWDRDSVVVEFDELLPDATDATAERRSKSVDNLTRREHAAAVSLRHRQRLAQEGDATSLWNDRKVCFPSIEFGPGVKDDLRDQETNFATIVKKLMDIDQAAAEWKAQGGPAPKWRTKVTDESTSLDPKYLNERRFPSYRGTMALFTWHARFGSSGRIHLRVDAPSREIEIGYIGPHLRP